MTLLPGLVFAVVLVWALGGNVAQFVTIKFRGTPLLYTAFGGQLVAFGPLRLLSEHQVKQVQIATYLLLILFCLVNRHLAGIWLVTCGVVSNALVICANGGVMPVDPSAIVASGWTIDSYTSAYPNVAAHGDAPLWVIGDVFAMPRFHGSAVLSIGDLLIIAGAWLVLQRAASPRPARKSATLRVQYVVALSILSLVTLLALASARQSFVLLAFAVLGVALAPAALSHQRERPPVVRCLSTCAVLCGASIALGSAISSYPTTVLAATTTGLLVGIGSVAVGRSRSPRQAGGAHA